MFRYIVSYYSFLRLLFCYYVRFGTVGHMNGNSEVACTTVGFVHSEKLINVLSAINLVKHRAVSVHRKHKEHYWL